MSHLLRRSPGLLCSAVACHPWPTPSGETWVNREPSAHTNTQCYGRRHGAHPGRCQSPCGASRQRYSAAVMIPRRQCLLRQRIIAMLSLLALLAGLAPTVRAALVQHTSADSHASFDGAAEGHAEHHGGHAGDEEPAGHASTGCCHAVCPASVMPPPAGNCGLDTGASGEDVRLTASTRLDGLRHAPPLRPPR